MRVFLLVCLSASLLHTAARASILVVPDQFPTIQSAINSAVDRDTVLIRPGSYQEALSFANKDLTLLGDGPPESVVIRAQSLSRVMMLGPGVTRRTTLRNLTIRDGRAIEGGGIRLLGASPVLTQCRFLNNVVAREDSTSKGGGLYVDPASNPLVTECLFEGNIADLYHAQVFPYGEGGGVHVAAGGSLSLRHSTFQGNIARGFEGGNGGGIYLAPLSLATIDSSLFVGNSGFGGGVYSEGSTTVRACTLNGNYGWVGPALLMYGTCSIEGNLIYDNEVDGTEGGAVWVYAGGMVVGNTIAFNRGIFEYAGLYAGDGTLISRNIIAGNDGKGFSSCFTDPGLVTCNDVWGNTVNGQPANYPPQCDLTGMNGNISVDPLFCAPETRDLTLNVFSPCATAPCGRMGAMGVGCGVNAMEETWASPRIPHLSIFPNPVGQVATFMIESIMNGWTLDIYDAQGRHVDVLRATGSKVEWAPPMSVGNGVYFCRERGGRAPDVVKFILLR